jgi:4-hydroxybenzoate polyprenyltransferase
MSFVSAAPDRWLRAIRVAHPFPTCINVATTGALGLVATRGHVRLITLVHLMAAMLAIQASIGIVNDLADRELDAAGGRRKPLVDASLSVGAARLAAAGALIAAGLLSMGFGVLAWLLAMGGLACGLVYDLRLKRTGLSALPYMVGLPLLPLWVWAALGRFRLMLLVLVPLGCLLALALHLANSLPDFETDRAAGVAGLAQRLGKGPSLATCWGSFALTAGLAGLSGLRLESDSLLMLAGFGGAVGCLALAVMVSLLRPGRTSLQLGWGLLAGGSALLAASWLSAFSGW